MKFTKNIKAMIKKLMNFPLTTKFRSTNLFKAFILNAVITAITSALLVELRLQLQDNKKTFFKNYITKVVKPDKDNNLHNYQKVLAVFITGIVVSFIVYNLMYYLLSFGGGMLTTRMTETLHYW